LTYRFDAPHWHAQRHKMPLLRRIRGLCVSWMVVQKQTQRVLVWQHDGGCEFGNAKTRLTSSFNRFGVSKHDKVHLAKSHSLWIAESYFNLAGRVAAISSPDHPAQFSNGFSRASGWFDPEFSHAGVQTSVGTKFSPATNWIGERPGAVRKHAFCCVLAHGQGHACSVYGRRSLGRQNAASEKHALFMHPTGYSVVTGGHWF